MIFENFLTQSSHFTGELERVSHKEGRRREGLPRSGGIDKENTIVANNNTKDFRNSEHMVVTIQLRNEIDATFIKGDDGMEAKYVKKKCTSRR